jgi:hypothetical protein
MKTISSTEIAHTPIFRVTLDRAIDPDGFEIQRAIVQHGGSAAVMPVDQRDRILLVRQCRLPARRYLWELPPRHRSGPRAANWQKRPVIAQKSGKNLHFSTQVRAF